MKDGRFVYKLFDKADTFSFFIVRMPHIHSTKHLLFCTTLSLNDFIEKAKRLLKRMQIQASKGNKTNNSLKKIIDHLWCVARFGTICTI